MATRSFRLKDVLPLNPSGDFSARGVGKWDKHDTMYLFPYALVMMSNALEFQKEFSILFFRPWRLLSPSSFEMLSC
jgi:hypothetical protein